MDAGEWRIPARRMKMKEQHIVPLARQSVEIVRELQYLTGSGRLVFPPFEAQTGRRLRNDAVKGATPGRVSLARSD